MIFSSLRRRSVTSSCVVSQPPSSSGRLTICTERPSAVSTMLRVTSPSATLRNTVAQKSSTLPLKDPVCFSILDKFAKAACRVLPPRATARTSRYSAGCRRSAAATNRYSSSPCVMLLMAMSSRCFSSVSRCCDNRCCCDNLRTARYSMAAITSTKSAGHPDQKPGLLPPIGQRGCDGRRRDHDDRKAVQLARGAQPLLAVDGRG